MATLPITSEWSIDLDPDFERHAEAGDLVLWRGGRTVYASVFQASNADAEQAIAAMLEGRNEAPVRTFDRVEAGVVAHAYLLPEQRRGADYWGLNTWTATRSSVACVTFYFEQLQDDLDWAVAAWRSIQCGACERYVN
jgi:hypothetical protein